MRATGKSGFGPSVGVAIGVIRSGGRFLVRRRPAGTHLEGAWEFPGGKIEPGERPEDAVRREVLEEAGLAVGETVLIDRREHAYPDRTVLLHTFLCLEAEGPDEPGEGFRWLSLEELRALEMPAANRAVLRLLAEQFEGEPPGEPS